MSLKEKENEEVIEKGKDTKREEYADEPCKLRNTVLPQLIGQLLARYVECKIV